MSRRRSRCRWIPTLIAAAVGVGGSVGMPATGHSSAMPLAAVVSADPADWTPDVLDGEVRSTATVGGVTVAVGDFTQVRERSTGTIFDRQDIFAFDATGKVLTSFAPRFTGNAINDVVAAGDGKSVFVGGVFSRVDDLPSTDKIARLDATSGNVDTGFASPGFDQRVTDLELRGDRLYVAGWFTTVGGHPHAALADLDPVTGGVLEDVDLTFSGTQNGGITGIDRMSVAPDGSFLVAIGNFATVDDQPRPQVAKVDLASSPAALDDWATSRYGPQCSPIYHSYVTDVAVAPDGSYFVIVSTGGYWGGLASGVLCDTVTRWDATATGPGQDPQWIDWTGGDTVTAVTSTGSIVYVGGHFRWMNNPFGNDAAAAGAVHRRGLAALDARNGLPLTWDPGRATGWGVQRFRVADAGLWIAHDTDLVAGERRMRLALMPAGASALPKEPTGKLPGRVVQLGSAATAYHGTRVLYRVNAGGPLLLSGDGGPDWAADTSSAPSTLHNWGSVAATWNRPIGRSDAVPAGTPQAVFTTERADSAADPEMSWNFPVAKGSRVHVRLYFANGCSCTAQPGDREFDVRLDGVLRLDNYDPVADAGDAVGTVKTLTLTSDGRVDVDFAHVVENPLVNAIEIIRAGAPHDPTPYSTRTVTRRFDGDGVTRTVIGPVTRTPVNWAGVRGSFMVGNRLYLGTSEGKLVRWVRRHGVFTRDRLVPLHGLYPFSNDLSRIRAMFYDRTSGRIYFTQAGDSHLFYRYFTPESEVIGAVRHQGTDSIAGVRFATVRGAFLAGDRLYFTTPRGQLRSVAWDAGKVHGPVRTLSGPRLDNVDWRGRSLFLIAG